MFGVFKVGVVTVLVGRSGRGCRGRCGCKGVGGEECGNVVSNFAFLKLVIACHVRRRAGGGDEGDSVNVVRLGGLCSGSVGGRTGCSGESEGGLGEGGVDAIQNLVSL